jgi:hypothetical protein
VAWFAYGWLETAAGEKRTILNSLAASGNNVELALNTPLIRATAEAAVTVYPGCDLTVDTCRSAKFNNLVNFRGTPYVAKNLTVRAMEAETAHGNKK